MPRITVPIPTKVTWTTTKGKKRTAWQVRYKDRTGRRRCKQVATKAEADEFAATITSAVRAGTHVHSRDTILVAHAAERWLAACERGRNGRQPCEPWTIAVYEQFVRLHIKPFLGDIPLNDLRPSRVRQFRDIDLLGGGRSRYLTSKVLTALSAICSDAVADEFLGVNPCTGITLVSNKREKDNATIPTKAQVRALMEVAERWLEGDTGGMIEGADGQVHRRENVTRWRALWWYSFLRMLITTGCRSSEIRGASWDALKNSKFSVYQRADYQGRIGPPKSRAGYRELDLDDGMMEALERWRAVCPKSKDNLMFSGQAGAPESLWKISKRLWYPTLQQAGIARVVRTADGSSRFQSPFTLHDLRHFHASLMIEAGMREKDLQEHMGHSSIKVTMDIYGHLFVDEESDARRRGVVTAATAGLLGATSTVEVARNGYEISPAAPVKRQSMAKNDS